MWWMAIALQPSIDWWYSKDLCREKKQQGTRKDTRCSKKEIEGVRCSASVYGERLVYNHSTDGTNIDDILTSWGRSGRVLFDLAEQRSREPWKKTRWCSILKKAYRTTCGAQLQTDFHHINGLHDARGSHARQTAVDKRLCWLPNWIELLLLRHYGLLQQNTQQGKVGSGLERHYAKYHV